MLNRLTNDAPWWLEQGLAQLERIPNPERNKKINTVIALIDARLAGNSDASVFRRDDTCTRRVWYEKWSKDDTILDVLAQLEDIVRPAHDERALRAMMAAATRIQLASPVAVGRAVQLIGSADEGVALRAAFGVLDRAGVATAAKSPAVQSETTISIAYAEKDDHADSARKT